MVLEVCLFVFVFTPVLLVILITFLIKLCHSYAVPAIQTCAISISHFTVALTAEGKPDQVTGQETAANNKWD